MSINYNTSRIVQYVPGNVIEAYGRSISGIYELPNNYRNSLSIAPAAFVVGLNTMVFTIPSEDVRITTTFELPVAFTLSMVIASVLDALSFFTTVSTDPTTPANLLVTLNAYGNRPFSLSFNAFSGTSPVVAVKPSIRAGRILVARGKSNQFSGNYNVWPLVSYPRLATDNSQTLGKIYLSGMGEHFPSCPDGLDRYSNSSNQVFPGGLVEAYTSVQGMVVAPVTAIDNNDPLFVECEEAGEALAGRITATPTATTIALPTSSLYITHGASVNQLAVVALH